MKTKKLIKELRRRSKKYQKEYERLERIVDAAEDADSTCPNEVGKLEEMQYLADDTETCADTLEENL